MAFMGIFYAGMGAGLPWLDHQSDLSPPVSHHPRKGREKLRESYPTMAETHAGFKVVFFKIDCPEISVFWRNWRGASRKSLEKHG